MAMDDTTLEKRTSKTTQFILRAKTDGREFPLHGEMLVGREVECAITLRSGHISRYHAKINVSATGVYLEDLHSTNGTFINGIKIKGRVRVNVGDEVGFDDNFFRLTTNASGLEAETALAAKFRPVADTATRLQNRPAATAPISPSMSKAQAQANRKAFDPSISQVISAIDLDGPMSLKQPPPDLSEFEQQVDQRFDELDALLAGNSFPPSTPQVKTLSQSIPAEPEPLMAPEVNVSGQAVTSEPAPIAEPAPVGKPAPVDRPAALKNPVRPTPKPVIAKPAIRQLESREETQRLGEEDANRLIARNRNHQEVRLGSGPRLIVTTAPLRGKMFSLSEAPAGGSFQIGREHKAEVFLTDTTVSSDHARITKVNDAYVITVSDAKNGLLVNGVRTNRVYLRHEDKIQIGRTELVFKNDSPKDGSLLGSKGGEELLAGAHGRRYSIIITVSALIVLIGAIIASSK